MDIFGKIETIKNGRRVPLINILDFHRGDVKSFIKVPDEKKLEADNEEEDNLFCRGSHSSAGGRGTSRTKKNGLDLLG